MNNFAKPNNPKNQEQPKNNSTLIIVVILLVVIVLGAGVYFFLSGGSGLDIGLSGSENSSENSFTNSSTVDDGMGMDPMNSEGGGGLDDPTAMNSTNSTFSVDGVNVGGLFIPSSINEKALIFLKELTSYGELPIEVDESALGKPNPFVEQEPGEIQESEPEPEPEPAATPVAEEAPAL